MTEQQLYDCALCGTEVRGDEATVVQCLGLARTRLLRTHIDCAKALMDGELQVRCEQANQEGGDADAGSSERHSRKPNSTRVTGRGADPGIEVGATTHSPPETSEEMRCPKCGSTSKAEDSSPAFPRCGNCRHAYSYLV